MKKIILATFATLFLTASAFAQDKDFTHMEIGAVVTSPVNEGEQVSILPSFILKQKVIAGLFTLQNLETQFGTGASDTTAFKLGFGYELPSFSLFSINGEPVGVTLDLLFSKDLVNGFENNTVIGNGIKFDRASTANFALIIRTFYNRVRDFETDPWRTVWSASIAGEFGIL
jgi:hypothetical protein